MRRSKKAGLNECTRPTMSRASSALMSSKLDAIDCSASSRELGFLGRLTALALGSPGDEFRIAFQSPRSISLTPSASNSRPLSVARQ